MKLPVVSGPQAAKALCRLGYEVDVQEASHVILCHSEPPHRRLSVPNHEELAKGTPQTKWIFDFRRGRSDTDTPPARRVATKENQVGGRIGPRRRTFARLIGAGPEIQSPAETTAPGRRRSAALCR
jgi:predicted RNA binding protein YcfA (HicA-like mRNA interferase family)